MDNYHVSHSPVGYKHEKKYTILWIGFNFTMSVLLDNEEYPLQSVFCKEGHVHNIEMHLITLKHKDKSYSSIY